MARTTKAAGARPTAPADEHAAAAQARAAAATGDAPVDPRTRQILDALAAERRGYVARGLEDRAAQVDDQIRKITEGV